MARHFITPTAAKQSTESKQSIETAAKELTMQHTGRNSQQIAGLTGTDSAYAAAPMPFGGNSLLNNKVVYMDLPKMAFKQVTVKDDPTKERTNVFYFGPEQPAQVMEEQGRFRDRNAKAGAWEHIHFGYVAIPVINGENEYAVHVQDGRFDDDDKALFSWGRIAGCVGRIHTSFWLDKNGEPKPGTEILGPEGAKYAVRELTIQTKHGKLSNRLIMPGESGWYALMYRGDKMTVEDLFIDIRDRTLTPTQLLEKIQFHRDRIIGVHTAINQMLAGVGFNVLMTGHDSCKKKLVACQRRAPMSKAEALQDRKTGLQNDRWFTEEKNKNFDAVNKGTIEEPTKVVDKATGEIHYATKGTWKIEVLLPDQESDPATREGRMIELDKLAGKYEVNGKVFPINYEQAGLGPILKKILMRKAEAKEAIIKVA